MSGQSAFSNSVPEGTVPDGAIVLDSLFVVRYLDANGSLGVNVFTSDKITPYDFLAMVGAAQYVANVIIARTTDG